jgi:hypothetical protein
MFVLRTEEGETNPERYGCKLPKKERHLQSFSAVATYDLRKVKANTEIEKKIFDLKQLNGVKFCWKIFKTLRLRRYVNFEKKIQ